ncbi:MAG: L-2-amino-thiazoline-4-carboxylic acid hydrolase, partial [Anaerolineaceae bacterium]|nr:L-2-amino-thiazoline-4-carboxylic acid hydrolase [Anaerolineaceae bacterium]
MSETLAHKSSYYLKNKSRIMQEVTDFLAHARTTIVELYGETTALKVADETLSKSEALFANLPDIGGDKNFLIRNFYLGAVMLSIYKVLKARAKPPEDAGRIVYNAIKSQLHTSPPPFLLKENEQAVQELISKRKKAAEDSQKRNLPYDWMTFFLEGDGKSFDWGIDYSSCGICKLYQDHAASEMIPFVCALDLPIYQARGIGLVRTKTLAQGD